MATFDQSDVVTWDAETVTVWLSSIGFTQYHNHIIEHGISGDVLVKLDQDTLKEVGVASLGQRLAILKAVYHLKIANHIDIEPDHYIPPSEVAESTDQSLTLDSIIGMIQDQNDRIRTLEEENQRLQDGLISLEEFIVKPSGSTSLSSSMISVRKQPSFKWSPYVKSVKSPTRAMAEENGIYGSHQESPRVSPQVLEQELSQTNSALQTPKSSEQMVLAPPSTLNPSLLPSYPSSSTSTILSQPPTLPERTNSSRQQNGSSDSKPRSGANSANGNEDRAENQFKSFKVSLDDPCWKVLPAALKKYKINDDWRQYAMFICYGNTERCLSYDEKPLLLFQKLKDANKNPVFMLRHIKDIRSPIAVAQQKQADRQQSSPPPYSQSAKRNDLNSSTISPPLASPSASSSYSRNTRLHQTPAASMQPISTKAQLAVTNTPPPTSGTAAGLPWSDTSAIQTTDELVGSRSRTVTEDSVVQAPVPGTLGPGGHADAVILSTGISYAIAIYPYMAELEDEFDVAVGSTFIIHARAKGWWIVQRDAAGSGVVDETAKRGWVPAGCLLETKTPPASAVLQASNPSRHNSISSILPIYTPGVQDQSDLPPQATVSRAPILPSSIVSTSFPGVALMDYAPKGDHELDLGKEDSLRVFKRYNHWSYAVKEDGNRGWVPSWLIGKVTAGPPTPMTAAMLQSNSQGNDLRYDGDETNGAASNGRGLTVSHISNFTATNGSSLSSAASQASPMTPSFALK